MSRTTAEPSPTLAARAAAVLDAKFPQHVPGERDGWLVLPRGGRLIAVWDLAVKVAADTPEQAAMRLELAQTLAAAGYVVPLTSTAYMVFVADRPHDTSGPRTHLEEGTGCSATGTGSCAPRSTARVTTGRRRPMTASRL